MEEIVETMNFSDDGTSFNSFSNEDHFEFGGKGKARRAARQEAKQEKKAARTEKKLAKADLRRSKGEAKIIKAQSAGARGGAGSAIGDVLGGIAKVVLPGVGASSEAGAEQPAATLAEGVDTSSAARTASDAAPAAEGGGMSKKMKMGIYIGGGVLLVGILAFVFLRPKKTA